ncbi:MAG: Biotin carboxylase of acetyl-CoA carboxylase [uncultured Rubrobacteraceae bacterium]|uniref:Biotin-dependent 3-methylcrotonyl-coenzyme A carboxylase alpha1 subunit n=1 Tax=uncultured Rubrobacteraceae bacterium TaxID=349277 RepID=A0A6J4R4K1_9ACTN|nr:MAG: Biotin carboxylase of acetyl-CoA carboxylase [uncultured Rubrobacteraceae bacterium]
MTFGSVLVANRGEIAVRIIRTCRELGIKSIAVYSEADESAMHRRLADEACLLGPPQASESYLNVGRLVEAIERSGAEAVHPGYGFLSESAQFARAVQAAGAVWVGPPPEAMESVGHKVRAKELANSAGVPTVPGYDGGGDGEDRLKNEADCIGYPVLVKASAGGGGRGMRAVTRQRDFVEAVRGARREAEAAFGDGSVFLEKLVEDPRHVEVQVLGDQRGNVIHLFERECSIQRRHQKVVEEAPSPALDPELRESICNAAVRFATEAGYTNAGTVEFLLDGDEFYFLEMNARLQVEHPVTELVTGLDLVQLQLAVAAGETLPLAQNDVSLRGSAIEARIYAEDEQGMPSGGLLETFSPPEGAGIRNDAGFEAGDEIPLDYDAMLAKLIVSAPDRQAAVRRLRRALADYEILGPSSNLPLLKRIAANSAFEAGKTTTSFLQEHDLKEPQPARPVPREALLLAAAAELHSIPSSPDPFAAGPWRLLGAATLDYDGHDVEAERVGSGRFRLSAEGEESVVEVLYYGDSRIRALIDEEPVEAGILLHERAVLLSLRNEQHTFRKPASPAVDEAGPGVDSAASLTAPMPGTVVKVLVEEGQEVEEGQLLLVLEAMKMEQPVSAPHAGVVRSLPFKEGSLVPGGAVLVEVQES